MIKRNFVFSCLVLMFALLNPFVLRANESAQHPEQILNQELLLNQLMTNIHILYLDFFDQSVREEIQEQMIQLDTNFKAWPHQTNDKESSDLLLTVKALWPVINRHVQWLSEVSRQSRPPETGPLLRALGKLDRQLTLLRQKHLSTNPSVDRKYRFLKQALMMQRLTKKYLSKESAEEQVTKKEELQNLASHFQQRLSSMQQNLAKHPHANQPLNQSMTAWQYIEKSIQGFPERQVPLMIVRYNNRIVSKLSSVQRMF